MVIFMLLASGGFTIARHVCSSSGVFVKVGMLGTTADCGMSLNPSACTSHPLIDNPPCCQNSVQTLIVDPFTVQSSLQVIAFYLISPLFFAYSAIFSINQLYIATPCTSDRASPFLHAIDRLAVICVFRK
jgi:hypothetical protein